MCVLLLFKDQSYPSPVGAPSSKPCGCHLDRTQQLGMVCFEGARLGREKKTHTHPPTKDMEPFDVRDPVPLKGRWSLFPNQDPAERRRVPRERGGRVLNVKTGLMILPWSKSPPKWAGWGETSPTSDFDNPQEPPNWLLHRQTPVRGLAQIRGPRLKKASGLIPPRLWLWYPPGTAKILTPRLSSIEGDTRFS